MLACGLMWHAELRGLIVEVVAVCSARWLGWGSDSVRPDTLRGYGCEGLRLGRGGGMFRSARPATKNVQVCEEDQQCYAQQGAPPNDVFPGSRPPHSKGCC